MEQFQKATALSILVYISEGLHFTVMCLINFKLHSIIIIFSGCGAGDFLNALADELDGVRCIGADIEHELIQQARLTSISMGTNSVYKYT